jgi:hypothetical protein
VKTGSLPALVLAAFLVMPALPSQPTWAAAGGPSAAEQLLSQRGGRGDGGGRGGGSNRRSGGGGNRVGGGGGGGGGGAGGRGGGGQARRSGNNSGFRTASPGLGRGSRQPQGGWTTNSRGRGTPSLDRAGSADRNRSADRARRDDRNRGGDRNRGSDRNRSRDNDRARQERLDRRDDRWDRAGNRRDDRWDRAGDRRDDRWDRAADRRDDRWRRASRDWNRWYSYPGWARPGWGPARPWAWGWYGGWSTPRWSWWGPSAAAWGITTLATAAIINAAVDNAVNSHTTYIVVPNTNYQLLYGTIRPVGTQSTTFSVIANNDEIEITADCDRGTLDGRNPRTRDEAELLNAACQVAFGTT